MATLADTGKSDTEEVSCWRALHEKARACDCEDDLESTLQQAVLRDPTSRYRNRVLIRASGDGNAEAVELMLRFGAKVNAYNEVGMTSLHAAAAEGHTHIAKVLIAHGADTRAASAVRSASSEAIRLSACPVTVLGHPSAGMPLQPKDGVTPLMLAAANGHLDVVKVLLSCGADAGAKDTDGRRAVAYASIRGHKDVVKALISHQAASTSTSSTAEGGQGPVKKASSMGGAAGGAFDELTPREVDGAQAMLVEAACAGDEAKVDEVLRSRLDLNVNALHQGRSALMEAVAAGHDDVVRKLLAEYRAYSDFWLKEKLFTSLMLAAKYGDEELLRLLLDHGADVNAKDVYGRTAVHYTIASADGMAIRCLELLKEHGGDVTAASNGGKTVLMLAARGGQMEVVRYLLANGADPTARDAGGDDAIAWAKATAEGCEVVGVLTEAVNAHMERLAAQIEGQANKEAEMHKDKNRKKKRRKKNGKGLGPVGIGDAQAGGGVGEVEVTVNAVDAGVRGGGDGGEEQQLQQITAAVAVASLHEVEAEPAAEEAEAQDSATVVPLSADADGIEEEAPAVELTEEDMDEAPTLFECPISHTIMRDPVTAQDGYSCERSHIETWIRKAVEDNVALRSPMTNEAMGAVLSRNLVLKFLVDEYVQRKLTEKKARLAAVAASV